MFHVLTYFRKLCIIEQKLEFKSNNFRVILCQILKKETQQHFLILWIPNICRGFLCSEANNTEAKCLNFCDKQRVLAPLLVTKFQTFISKTAGLRLWESSSDLGNFKWMNESFRLPSIIFTTKITTRTHAHTHTKKKINT